jgi:PRTRC genetic system ThiF family protein
MLMKVSFSEFAILQVGCGGTGGYLVPKLARLIMTLEKYREVQIGYNLVDYDIVEEINLYRQNFVKSDLARNKAEVLAQRYGSHFNVPIGAIDVKAETPKELEDVFPEISRACRILIGCVDNNNARKVMQEVFENSKTPIIYIDSGNGKFTGQIVIGYKNTEVLLEPVGTVFPESLIEMENQTPRNCALNALENPQNIGANDMAATLIFCVLNALLTNGEINTQIITFDALTGTARAITTNPEDGEKE